MDSLPILNPLWVYGKTEDEFGVCSDPIYVFG